METVKCPFCGSANSADILICPRCGSSRNDFVPDDTFDREANSNDANVFLANVAGFLYQAAPLRFPDIDLSNVTANLKIYKPEIPSEVTEMVSKIELPNFNLSLLDLSGIEMPDVDITRIMDLFANVDISDVDLSPLADVFANVDISDIDLSPLFDFLADIDIDF